MRRAIVVPGCEIVTKCDMTAMFFRNDQTSVLDLREKELGGIFMQVPNFFMNFHLRSGRCLAEAMRTDLILKAADRQVSHSRLGNNL